VRAIPGLSFAGIDFMTTDITQPQTEDSYVIIEVNTSPGFDIHDSPYVGKNRHSALEFLYLMLPELKNSALSSHEQVNKQPDVNMGNFFTDWSARFLDKF
jgi:hypothetical protein